MPRRQEGQRVTGPWTGYALAGSYVIKSFVLRHTSPAFVTYDDELITVSPEWGVVRSLDLPDQPDEPSRAMRADASGADRNTHRSLELPDPDERGRAYDAVQAHVSAETPADPSTGQRPDADNLRSYHDEASRYHDVRADRERRSPEGPHAAADRPGDRLDLPAATAGAVDRTRDGERTLSPDAEAIERQGKQGGWLEGPEHRLKGEDRLKGNVSAETPEEASPGHPPDATDPRSYWDEVPRFRRLWAEHEKDWPTKRRAAVDRSADPAGSYRSDGDFYLNPERHAQVIEAIRDVRKAEPTISADIRATERENTYGCWLEGFKNRLKGGDRLKEKVAERREGVPDKTPTEILREVPDAVRFTFCAQSESYARGYYDIKERLESRGYEMYESRNTWDGTGYKGVNTRWVTRDGQRFELQFHTPESYHAKEHVTHRAYERIRNPLTSDEERAELKEFQREVYAHIQVPNGAVDIPDFKKEGF